MRQARVTGSGLELQSACAGKCVCKCTHDYKRVYEYVSVHTQKNMGQSFPPSLFELRTGEQWFSRRAEGPFNIEGRYGIIGGE